MKTIIISGFPGIGKSTFFKENENVIDSDSSKFDKKYFPDNYIKHIKQNMGKQDFILVSSHKEVREALFENGLDFCLVYPDKKLKSEYINRYEKRGNDNNFIDLLNNNWDEWIDDIEKQKGCVRIKLGSKQFLSDIISNDEKQDNN